jgi:hypothetical protein
MRLVVLLLLALAAPASAQPMSATPADVLLDQAAICTPGPGMVEIGLRAAGRGWTELKRGEALKLQATADRGAQIQGWTVPMMSGPPVYLLTEAPAAWSPRRISCELVVADADRAGLAAALEARDFFGTGIPLGPPRLSGAWGQGGTYVEWAAPEGSPWRTISLVSQPPPRRGLALTRIRFSGVEN